MLASIAGPEATACEFCWGSDDVAAGSEGVTGDPAVGCASAFWGLCCGTVDVVDGRESVPVSAVAGLLVVGCVSCRGSVDEVGELGGLVVDAAACVAGAFTPADFGPDPVAFSEDGPLDEVSDESGCGASAHATPCPVADAIPMTSAITVKSPARGGRERSV